MDSADFKRPNDFIQWWVENVQGKIRDDTYALTAAIIQLNIAGIQSTGMVVSTSSARLLRKALLNPEGHASPF